MKNNFFSRLVALAGQNRFRAGFIVLLCVVLSFYAITALFHKDGPLPLPTGTASAQESFGTLYPKDASVYGKMESQARQIELLNRQLQNTNDTLEQIGKQLNRDTRRRLPRESESSNRLEDRKALLQARLEAQKQLLEARAASRDTSATGPVKEQAPAIRVGLPETPPPPLPVAPPPPLQEVTLLPGSIANGRLLHGIAELADENDIPVTIVADTNFQAPNGAVIRAKGCRLQGEAEMREATASASIELTQIACTLPSGYAFTQEIKGYVTGPDNVLGLRGTVFYNDGQIAKHFGLAAIPTALVSLFRELTSVQTTGIFGTTTSISSDISQVIGTRMATLLLQRARPFLTPVVFIPQNQPANPIILAGGPLRGVTPDMFLTQRQRNALD